MLPCVRAAGEMTSPAQRRRPAGEPGSPPGGERLGRVLVVEDEPDVAELIRFNLHKEGYEVTVLGNGGDAIRHAREGQPDVVLLDIMVPQLNGWEVCRRLKQDPDTRRIPVIMVTGRVDEGDKVLGFELGADDYVTKPFSPRELVARVRAVTRRGRLTAGAGQEAPGQGGRSRDRSRALRGPDEGAPGRAHAQGIRAPRDPCRGTGPGVWAGGAARPRLGPRRFRGAPHRGCPCRPPAR